MQKRVSGFTFIKNGLSLGYPIKESIESIEPLCDEIIINVGFDGPGLINDDGTYQYLRDHFKGDRYVFLKSEWDPQLTSKGLILSEQTNIALKACQGKYCQYIQGDEAIHEKDLEKIQAGLNKMDQNEQINGLVFNYFHFYGNTDVLKHTRNIYRQEVRLIRNHQGIKSHLDAQSFRNADESKVVAALTGAYIYHYGWARQEQVMNRKIKSMDKLFHGSDFTSQEFEYRRIWGLKKFKHSHPKVMGDWIKQHHNNLDILKLKWDLSTKDIRLIISDGIEALTGKRLGEHKTFKLI